MKIPQKPPQWPSGLDAFNFFGDEKLLEFVNQCNKKYYPWDTVRRIKDPRNKNPEVTWIVMKFLRSQQYKALSFGKKRFVYLVLDETQSKLHKFDKGGAGKILSTVDSISAAGRRDYIISSLMEEAIASSQLEGAATTRQVAKEILRTKKKPASHSEQMIVNGYRAMEHITKIKGQPLTAELLLELHRIITTDTLGDKEHEGAWRDTNEIVVADPLDPDAIYHRPPEHEKLPELIKELCDFANNEETFIHPILKGILLHFLIGYIHPFHDGNGRTARAIFYWYVLSKGYWLFEYMALSRIILRSKVKYGLAYLHTETDDNDVTYFINYNIEAIDEAFNAMQEYIARRQKEQEEAANLIRGTRDINLRQAQILKDALKRPDTPITIAGVVGTYAVVYQTARTDLLHLVTLGYLERHKVRKQFVFTIRMDRFKA